MGFNDTFYANCRLRLVPKFWGRRRLEEMSQQITPVVRRRLGSYRFFRTIDVREVDRRQVSFLRHPRLGEPVKLYLNSLNAKTILTFHAAEAAQLFRPTLAEVYGSIVRFVEDWSVVRYFWLVTSSVQLLESHHVCQCVLFGPQQLKVVDPRWDQLMAQQNSAGKGVRSNEQNSEGKGTHVDD